MSALLRRAAFVATAALVLAVRAAAQQAPPPRDTVRLPELLAAAASADPRRRQLPLQQQATALRLRTIDADLLPSLSLRSQAQYQSAVTSIAIPLPGVTIPPPPHDTYDAQITAEQRLLDPSLGGRREVERARLAEAVAGIRTTLFAQRQEVTDAFFTAAALQERLAEVDAAIVELAARLRETALRFRAGTALRADTASIAATLVERRQDRLTLAADRAAALARLALLTGRAIAADARLAVPALATRADSAMRALDSLRARPEFAQFAATRERLARQEDLASAQERPRVSAYGRLGYGRPGLNMLSSDFQSYWIAGVQLTWTPFRWGTTDRDRELLAVEREIVATNEAQFARSLARATQAPIARIAAADSALTLDARVIALREEVERDARAQLAEGVITAAAYVDRSTDLLLARVRRAQHRVELEQARAALLNTLGMEVR